MQECAAHSCDNTPEKTTELPHLTEPVPRPTASIKVLPPTPQKSRVTIEKSVEAYLADARSRVLEIATLSKLDTIFRKQLLAWTRVQGLEYLDQLDLDALLSFRETWKDGRMAKQKKTEPSDWLLLGRSRSEIAQPCIDPNASAFRMSKSNVP